MALTYDPDACRTFSEDEVVSYVTSNLEAGRSICSIDKPEDWDNQFSPYKVRICNGTKQVVQRAEIYPDCGLEWRDP